MSGHPPELLSQEDMQSPTMDKKFYNIKYQDLHVGIAVIYTHNPSLCWYACDYHHLHCPNMLIFAKYQDYKLDLHPIPDSFVGQSMKHSYHQLSWWSGEKEAAALTPACSFTHILLSPPHLHSVAIPMTHVYILPLLTCLQNVYLHSPITRTSPVQKDHFHDIGMPVTHSYVVPMLACLWKLNLL